MTVDSQEYIGHKNEILDMKNSLPFSDNYMDHLVSKVIRGYYDSRIVNKEFESVSPEQIQQGLNVILEKMRTDSSSFRKDFALELCGVHGIPPPLNMDFTET